MVWLLVVFAVIGLVALVDRWVERYRYVPTPDEVRFVETSDGWRLALSRYRARTAAPKRVPVLICPGIAVNGGFFDHGGPTALPRWLAARGWDVWMLEMRGVGLSRRPTDRARADWDYDTLATVDVPTAIAAVRDATGADRVHWVGHSLGGMVLAPTLGCPDPNENGLAAAVLVGSGLVFHLPGQGLLRRGARVLRLVGYPRVRLGLLSRLVAPLARWFVPAPGRWLMTPKHIDMPLRRDFMVSAIEPIAGSLLRQLGDSALAGALQDRERGERWLKGLAACRTPTLLLAGAGDLLFPPDAVRATADLFAEGTATVEALGTASGCSVDFGHGDLVLGARAPEDVFPRIERWLDTRGEPRRDDSADNT